MFGCDSLKGTDAANAKRMVLVTGHYDSRNTDMSDVKGAAPGANDDGSGTAVSAGMRESGGVKMEVPATMAVFLTVARKREGLNGSKHFAPMVKEKMAKDQGWDLEAVLNNDIVGGDKRRRTGSFRRCVVFFGRGSGGGDRAGLSGAFCGLGGESDSGSRELARYTQIIGPGL